MADRKITRSSITGRFVPKARAKKYPKTTVTETVKGYKKKRSNKK